VSKMLDKMLTLRLDKAQSALETALYHISELRKPSKRGDMLHGCLLIEACDGAKKMAHQVHGIVCRLDTEAYSKRKGGK